MFKRLADDWKTALGPVLEAPYVRNLRAFLENEKKTGATIYPKSEAVFNAFKQTPFDKVKVVILGQDPYHGPGQAHGLSFSVPEGIPFPPSLRNIFKELSSDIPGFISPKSGDLTHWAAQGVLLLNATLTVRAAAAGSHQKQGWEHFTNAVIAAISKQKSKVVFVLWGNFAQQKAELIDKTKHHIIASAHPSPLSAHNGFFGSRPFSKVNTLLQVDGLAPINWQLPV